MRAPALPARNANTQYGHFTSLHPHPNQHVDIIGDLTLGQQEELERHYNICEREYTPGVNEARVGNRTDLIVVEVIEGGDDGDDAGVLAVDALDALEGVRRVVLHERQVEARLEPPGALCFLCAPQAPPHQTSRPCCYPRTERGSFSWYSAVTF